MTAGFLGCKNLHVREAALKQITVEDDYSKEKLRTLRADIETFQEMVEEALTLRQSALAFAHAFQSGEQESSQLSSQELRDLSLGLRDYLGLRERMLKLIYKYEPWNNDQAEKQLNKNVRTAGVMLSIAGALTLYDNYNAAVYLYQGNKSLRRKLNEADQAYELTENSLLQLGMSFHSLDKRARVRGAVKRYINNKNWVIDMAEQDDDVAYLHILIEKSPSLSYFYGTVKLDQLASVMLRDITVLREAKDIFKEMRVDTMNLLSGMFGNGAGLLPAKIGKDGRMHGLMYDKPVISKDFQDNLRPLDILLEKTPFRMTDKFTPGFFGHVAVWLGTKNQLQQLGVWEGIKPAYQKQIEAGRSVLEALRDGVQLNTIEHFLNVDDAAILRPKTLTPQQRKDSVILGFGQVGKKYDFNFNVESQDKIVCSELAFVMFPMFKWPTQRTLGRYTISPDHVAEKALKDGPFELITFYFNGQNLGEGRAFDFFQRLHNGEQISRKTLLPIASAEKQNQLQKQAKKLAVWNQWNN